MAMNAPVRDLPWFACVIRHISACMWAMQADGFLPDDEGSAALAVGTQA